MKVIFHVHWLFNSFLSFFFVIVFSNALLAYYFVVIEILADMLDELQEHVESIDMANGKFVTVYSVDSLYSFYENS